jgi:hypothetical protein
MVAQELRRCNYPHLIVVQLHIVAIPLMPAVTQALGTVPPPAFAADDRIGIGHRYGNRHQ